MNNKENNVINFSDLLQHHSEAKDDNGPILSEYTIESVLEAAKSMAQLDAHIEKRHRMNAILDQIAADTANDEIEDFVIIATCNDETKSRIFYSTHDSSVRFNFNRTIDNAWHVTLSGADKSSTTDPA